MATAVFMLLLVMLMMMATVMMMHMKMHIVMIMMTMVMQMKKKMMKMTMTVLNGCHADDRHHDTCDGHYDDYNQLHVFCHLHVLACFSLEIVDSGLYIDFVMQAPLRFYCGQC